jgi:hypothetical protein
MKVGRKRRARKENRRRDGRCLLILDFFYGSKV